ncbi:ABC transporter substrate-binding protein [Xylophilus sp. GW821-FHT01B05]
MNFNRLMRYIARPLGIAWVGLLAMGGAATAATPETPVRGGTLVAVVQPEPSVLTSSLNVGQPVSTVSNKIFDGLLRLGEGLKLEPELAQSWTVSPDGKTITFNLRRGVKWHDGQPFTSADVRYSIENVWRLQHPRLRTALINVHSVETPDPATVILRLDRPSPVILLALNRGEAQVLPRHLYEGTDLLRNPYNARPVGTGPFRFKEWVRGERIVLERNPDYWDAGKPYLDGVVFRVIPDAATRAAALERGDVQYGNAAPIGPVDLQRFEKLPGIRVETRGYEYWGTTLMLEFNLRNPQLQDVRVRRAIAQAIDRPGLVRVVYRGFGKAAVSPIPSTLTQFHTSDVERYEPDLKEAARLLDEAGFKPGANGVRLKLRIDWLPFGDTVLRTAEYIRQSLKRVGVDLEIRNQDLARFYQRVYTERDFDLSIVSMSSLGDPQIGVERLYWSKTILPGVPFSNGSGYSSPAMDGLIQAAHEEADPARRAEYYRKFQRLALTDLPALPLLEIRFSTVYSDRVRGLSLAPDGGVESFKNVWLGAPAGQVARQQAALP